MVQAYVQRTPIVEPSMQRASIALDWLQTASTLGSIPMTTGSVSDVAAQLLAMGDTHLRQMPRALRWRGEGRRRRGDGCCWRRWGWRGR
jgi:hypothetical protein